MMSTNVRTAVRKIGLVTLLAVIAGAAPAAPAVEQDASEDQLTAFVSILPQAYFLERIGQGHVDVNVLVGPGQSPHAFQATPKQMVKLGTARVYFSIGIGFEDALLPRIKRMFKDLTVVDTRAGVPLRQMATADDHAGHEGEHEHGDDDHGHAGGPDPHIWLSPTLAGIQAETMCDALVKLDPDHADDYRRNLAALQSDLNRIHAELAKVLAPFKGQSVFVFHPAFGYFLDEFGLTQVPVEIEGKRPAARQLVKLIERAKAEKVRMIFVQPQFSRKSAEAVATAIDGVVVPMDPLAGDYLENLRRMAQMIEVGLKK